MQAAMLLLGLGAVSCSPPRAGADFWWMGKSGAFGGGNSVGEVSLSANGEVLQQQLVQQQQQQLVQPQQQHHSQVQQQQQTHPQQLNLVSNPFNGQDKLKGKH